MLKKLLGINWKTTLPGILVLVGVVAKFANAVRQKDIGTVLMSTQELSVDIPLVLAGLGLITAKASDVTGTGKQSVAVDSSGNVTNAEGDKLGKQQAVEAVANVVMSKVKL